MPKLNKMRKRQKFGFNRSRKRMRKTTEKHMSKNVRVTCDVLKNEWDTARPVKHNLESMGLVFDANSAIKTKSTKRKFVENLTKGVNAEEDDVTPPSEDSSNETEIEESDVVVKLRDEAEKSGKRSKFRLPAEDVRWVTKMMDRHGDDFAAMERDPDNIFQLTANKIRRRVTKFISVPEQFEPYARERGLLDDARQILDDDDYEEDAS